MEYTQMQHVCDIFNEMAETVEQFRESVGGLPQVKGTINQSFVAIH